MTQNEEETTILEKLRFSVDRNARYHARRAGFLAFVNKSALFLIILLGSAEFSGAAVIKPFDVFFGAVIATLGALTLVFDWGGQSKDHEALFSQYKALIQDLVKKPSCSDEEVAELSARYEGILSQEKGSYYKALNTLCHNEVMVAHGRKGKLRKVGPIPRLLANVFKFSSREFPEKV